MSAEEWKPTAEGTTLGTEGPHGARIVRDESTERGTRIMLEEDPSRDFYVITSGIPEWLNYDRYFDAKDKASRAYEEMRGALLTLAAEVPLRRSPPGTKEIFDIGAKLTAFTVRFG